MFLAKVKYEGTAWHMATHNVIIEVLNKLCEWAKEVLTPVKLRSMFLAKDEYERTAWRIASEQGQTELLHKTWE